MTKLLMLIFLLSFIKPSLEICLVTPKEGIVTLRVPGLAAPGCKGLSTMVRRPTYARHDTPKNDDVIYEQPLSTSTSTNNASVRTTSFSNSIVSTNASTIIPSAVSVSTSAGTMQ